MHESEGQLTGVYEPLSGLVPYAKVDIVWRAREGVACITPIDQWVIIANILQVQQAIRLLQRHQRMPGRTLPAAAGYGATLVGVQLPGVPLLLINMPDQQPRAWQGAVITRRVLSRYSTRKYS